MFCWGWSYYVTSRHPTAFISPFHFISLSTFSGRYHLLCFQSRSVEPPNPMQTLLPSLLTSPRLIMIPPSAVSHSLRSSPTLYAGRLLSIVILTTSTSSPAVTSIVIVNGPRVSSIGCRESTPVHEIVHAEDNGCTKNTGCSSSADND